MLWQLVLDCWNTGDWGGIAGYPVKFAIGFISVFFDLIFLLQVCAVVDAHVLVFFPFSPKLNPFEPIRELLFL